MQELVSASLNQAQLPEGWFSEPGVAVFEQGGLRSGRVTFVTIPLPATAWGKLHVEVQVVPIAGAILDCSDHVLHVVLELAGADYPRHRVTKYRHELGYSTRRIARKPGIRTVKFEFEQGQLRGLVDGEEVIAATDPLPLPFVGNLILGFWDDCLVRHVRVFGDAAFVSPLYPALPRKSEDFFLEVNVDFPDDLERAPFTQKMFADLFAEFQSWGVRRCHWIYYGGRKNGWWDLAPLGIGENAAKTFENVDDIFKTAVKAAHACGIQLIGMMKPLDMGFGWSYAEGTAEAKAKGRAMRIGGPVGWIANFPAEHPEFLTARRPDTYGPAENEVFTRIDLVKEDDASCAFSVNDVELYISDDNACYRSYQVPIQRQEIIEDYPIYVHTPSGAKRTENTRRVRVMRLNGLQIRNKYLVLALPSRSRSFTNTFVNLVHVFGEKGEERRLTYGNEPRLDRSKQPQDFRTAGLEFDHYSGTATAVFSGFDAVKEYFTLDGRNGILGIARGKDRGPLAHLSPWFPEAREWWLSWIRDILEAGADGVELRVRNHHSDWAWAEYGFEAPVVNEFKKRYGVDLLLMDDFDRAAFRRLRGEAYTQFYREAKQLVRSYGKTLGLHVSTTMDMEPEQGAAMEVHWDWRTWLKEGLADSVTMKEVWPRTRMAHEVLSYTRPRNVPVIFCPYANTLWTEPGGTEVVANRIREAQGGSFDGLQYYECASVVRATPDGRIIMEQPALRELFRKVFLKGAL